MAKQVSITEVAKLAEVSITTVSRVMNGSSHPVSEQTRKKVLQAAKELNYSPSALAQAMVRRDTKIVGVLVSDTADPYFASIVRGIEDVARNYGYVVIVTNSDRVPDIEINNLKVLDSYRVDGVIFAGSGIRDEDYVETMRDMVKALDGREAAVVTLGEHQFPSIPVLYDNQQVAYDAASYLIDNNHREIGFVAGPERSTSAHLRRQGFIGALKANNIDINSEFIAPGDYTFDAGVLAAQQFLQLDELPTAILCSNDMMAIGCMSELKKQVKIPEDVSVMGIGNIEASRFSEPGLTSVKLPLHDLGALAMDCLIQAREEKLTPSDLPLLQHELVIRESTRAI